MSLLTRAVSRHTGRTFVATSTAGGIYGYINNNNNNSSSSNSMTITSSRNNFVACESSSGSSFDLSKLLGGGKTEPDSAFKKPDWINVDTMQPLAGGLTFGGASGLAAGIACKKIGKAVAAGVGGLYCMFQVAASYGYITVNWKKVEKDVMTVIDTNGDGKVDEKDMGIWVGKALKVLSNEDQEGLASRNAAAGGFLTGFLYGLRF